MLMKTTVFAFVSLLFAASICAQTKVSSVEELSHPEEQLVGSISIDTVSWRNELFIVNTSGTDLHLIAFDTDNPVRIDIDLQVSCAAVNFHRIQIYEDQLFVASNFIIFEINLSTETLEHVYYPSTERRIELFSKDMHNGLLVTFARPSQLIARIDLDTKDISYKDINPSSSIFILGDYIVNASSDNLFLTAHDLIQQSEIPLVVDSKFSLINTTKNPDKRHFYDEGQVLYELSKSLELTVVCTDFETESYSDFFVFNGFIYSYGIDLGAAQLPRHFIMDLSSCQIVASFIASPFSSSLLIKNHSDDQVVIWTESSLLFFNEETYELKLFTFPVNYLIGDVTGDKYAYGYSEADYDEVEIYRLDLESEQFTTFESGLKTGFSRIMLRATDDHSFTLASNISGKNTLVEFDSSFTETRRLVYSEEQNLGLQLENDALWTKTEGAVYLPYKNNLFQIEEDSLVQLNDSLYHRGLIYVRDTLYAFYNRNDSTFFTVSHSDTLIYELQVEYRPLNGLSQRMLKAGNAIYSVASDSLTELYPTPSSEVVSLPVDINGIYNQFQDKALVLAKVDNKNLLAIYDGSDLEVLSQTETWGGPRTYQVWYENKTIRIFVFRAKDGGSVIVSTDELSGEVLFVEEVAEIRQTNYWDDQRSRRWKVFSFIDRNDGIYKVVVTDGLDVRQYDLSAESTTYGTLGIFHFANNHLFFTADGKDYVMNQDREIKELPQVRKNLEIESVLFANDKYYTIGTDEYTITVTVRSADFSGETNVFETENIRCLSYLKNYFLSSREDNTILLVLNTLDFGIELWELDLDTDEVSLFTDLNEGQKNGFKELQFMLDGQLYFTATEEDFNIQLYKIDILQQQITTTTREPIHTSFSVYPNPSSGLVFIDTPLSHLRIMSSSGAEYPVLQLDSASSVTIEVEHLPSGIYFLTGIDDQGIVRSSKVCKL